LPLVSDQVELLERVLGATGTLLAAVPSDAASRPTPCPGLDVAALVAHLDEWIARFADAAEDPEVSGSSEASMSDASASDPDAWPAEPAAHFRAAAARAVAGFRHGATERQLSITGGPTVPGAMVVGMMLMEYIGHGWDLAVATGQPVPFGDEESAAALAAGRQMLSEDFRGPDKSFGPAVPVPSDATALERLIGFLGRDPYSPPM
jgi:uncharacterized protein (TIGR03086 family)